MSDRPMKLAAVLFPDFETLDLFGPLQVFGNTPDLFDIVTVGPAAGPVRSRQGQAAIAAHELESCPTFDAMLIPGGHGTRALAEDTRFIDWLRRRGEACALTMSVCTGAGLLARAGLLDGRRATTNKLAFDWVRSQGPGVEWIPRARWVEDGEVVTAAGISAGIDMALAVVARLAGNERARLLAQITEYEWHEDSSWDPFSRLAGIA